MDAAILAAWHFNYYGCIFIPASPLLFFCGSTSDALAQLTVEVVESSAHSCIISNSQEHAESKVLEHNITSSIPICNINIEADVFSLIKTELCLLNFRF